MNKRFATLDVMRGLTVAFMCIVNNPGNWGKLYPPLAHAHWDGCTPTDLVFPFFVFCMGCAMAFSLARYDGFTRMLFTLHTGRTHQIRVHMSSIGHPLMGDTVYGGGRTAFEKKHAELLCGQCLHARYIGFVHPGTGEYMEFDGGLPEYFEKAVSLLK